MGQLQLSGNLTSGPPQGAEFSQGRMMINIALALKGGAGCKAFGSATGVQTRNLNSPSAYVVLSGVGPDDTVTRGDTLYVFAPQPILVRITTDDGVGGDVVSVLPLDGLMILEINQVRYLKLLEAQGACNGVEYFVSGQQ